MAAVAAPPQAPPPAGVTIVDTGPPKAPPPPTTQIRVSQMPAPANPDIAQPKGKAFDRLRSDLAKKAKPGTFEPTESPEPSSGSTPPSKAPAARQPPASPRSADGDESEGAPGTPTTEGAPSSEPETQPETPAPAPAEKTPEGKKVSPWKLVDQFKERTTKAEARALELEKQLIPEADRKAFTEKLSTLEKRNQELESEIRFVNYKKSKEFQDEHQKPYEDAWRRAMTELSEISIEVDGQRRAVTSDDVLSLVNLPLGQARDIADQVFGKFADDVMAHRKTIKNLFDSQLAKLEEVRKNGEIRDKENLTKLQAQQSEMGTFIKQTWDKVNTDALNHAEYGKFFKPVEGDQEGNQRLAKGFELVDRAFNETPSDPRLTPEQRAAVVKRHAAVRNRAAAFGRLVYQNSQLTAQLAELQKKLDSINGSVPETGVTTPETTTVSTSGRAIDRVFGDLRKLAKPA